MFKTTRKSRLVKVAAATAAIGSIAAIGFVGNSPAQAEPQQYLNPIVGVGSDTTQDVVNAFAGFSNGINYTPLQAGTARTQIASWDAFKPGTDPTLISCITTKVAQPQITRPNGSGSGVFALTAAFNAGATFPVAADGCGPARSLGGIVDFARSSSGPDSTKNPSNPTGPLVFVPFGRDALTFAYIRPSGSPVTSLTRAELNTIHVSGPQVIGGVPVIACGIQTASGTFSSWRRAVNGASAGTWDPGTSVCNNVGVGAGLGRIQENNGPELVAKSALLASMSADACDGALDGISASCANAQLIVGFSASQFIARTAGLGTPAPALTANGGLGLTNGVAAVTGTSPSFAPNPTFYADTNFGRDVYNVLPAETIIGADSQPALVAMFVGDTSRVCSLSTTTIQSFGFLSLGTSCGSVTLRSNFRTAP